MTDTQNAVVVTDNLTVQRNDDGSFAVFSRARPFPSCDDWNRTFVPANAVQDFLSAFTA